MRIAFIHQYYAPDLSAVAQLVASLAEHRARLGDEVTVIASQGGYVPESLVAARDSRTNPKVHRLWTPRLGKRTIVQRLVDYASFYFLAAMRMLTLPPQDVVVVLTTPPLIGWTGVVHRVLHRHTKLLIWNMDCYPDAAVRSGLLRSNGTTDRLLTALNRALMQRMDHVVCLDTAMAELLDRNYRLFPSIPFTVIPNWEPLATYAADAPHPPWANAEPLGLRGCFVVLYAGNAGVGHQFDSVIEAARRLRSDPVKFLFMGGGKCWPWLEAEQRKHGLENIVFQPYVAQHEVPSVMSAANCALITLRDEMLGVMSPSKLHANLAAGLPILYVGPPKSNVDDAIRRFGCGASLRHGDIDGIVTFVRRCINEPREAATFGSRARDAFERAYCDQVNLQKFDQLIDSLRIRDAAASSVPIPSQILKRAS